MKTIKLSGKSNEHIISTLKEIDQKFDSTISMNRDEYLMKTKS